MTLGKVFDMRLVLPPSSLRLSGSYILTGDTQHIGMPQPGPWIEPQPAQHKIDSILRSRREKD